MSVFTTYYLICTAAVHLLVGQWYNSTMRHLMVTTWYFATLFIHGTK